MIANSRKVFGAQGRLSTLGRPNKHLLPSESDTHPGQDSGNKLTAERSKRTKHFVTSRQNDALIETISGKSSGLPNENFNKKANNAKRPEKGHTNCLKARKRQNFICGVAIPLSQKTSELQAYQKILPNYDLILLGIVLEH